MRTSKHEGYFAYHEGDYSLEVYNGSYVCLKHKCPRSRPKDNCYDIILPDEIASGLCRYCATLHIPESLQALYYLMKWEEGA